MADEHDGDEIGGAVKRLTRAWPDPARALLLLACVVVAYIPAMSGDVVWDDDVHLTSRALQSLDGLRRIWFDLGATQQYYPLLHSAFWAEHRLWGDLLTGYHLVNIAEHGIAAILLVAICQRLRIQGAWIAGFLFALHPVAVETVAWISEQKNTLSLMLYLLAALVYLGFDEKRRARDYAIATVLFVAALASKTVTSTLPAALLVVAWWKRGRIEWKRDVVPLLPWFVVAIGSGMMTAWVERRFIGADGADFALSAMQRVQLAGRASVHYLGTLAWPAHLVFNYPRWTLNADDVVQYGYLVAVALLVLALWRLRHWSRAPLAALLLFLGSLVPALGFVDVYPFRYSYVADHFQYLADIGPLVLGGAVLSIVLGLASASRWRIGLRAAIVALFATLGAMSWRLSGNFHDATTLYAATIAENPASWMAHHNLGRILMLEGRFEAAIPHFEAAIRLKPDHARAHFSLGVALAKLGRDSAAAPHLEVAMQLEPGNPPLVANSEYLLGVGILHMKGNPADAVERLAAAVRINPNDAGWHDSYGDALVAAGRKDDARHEYEEALRVTPGDVRAQMGLRQIGAGKRSRAVPPP